MFHRSCFAHYEYREWVAVLRRKWSSMYLSVAATCIKKMDFGLLKRTRTAQCTRNELRAANTYMLPRAIASQQYTSHELSWTHYKRTNAQRHIKVECRAEPPWSFCVGPVVKITTINATTVSLRCQKGFGNGKGKTCVSLAWLVGKEVQWENYGPHLFRSGFGDNQGRGAGVVRSRRFLGGVGFLTTLGVGVFCPTPSPNVQLDDFLHHTPKLGIPVVMVQFLPKLLLKPRFFAVHHDFHWF